MNINNKKTTIIIVIISIIILALSAYFLFMNKETASIELLGEESIVIYQNEEYIEPGYTIANTNNPYNFTIDIIGDVNSKETGIYHLKYQLYDPNGKLISTKERQVVVMPISIEGVDLKLKGEKEEVYFINDYVDDGAEAYNINQDISNLITIDSDVNPSKEGTYTVTYKVVLGNTRKEVVRTIHIVNLNINENINRTKSQINLINNTIGYSYTLLPDKSKDYGRDILYSYKTTGVYTFDIYLKSGSHMTYNVNIDNIDNVGPTGTCTLNHENNTTTINLNVTDPSGINKYTYNGSDFNSNTKTLSTLTPQVTIRAYDNYNNYTDIPCKSVYGTAFRNINLKNNGKVANKLGYISCNTNTSNDEKQLAELIQSYGYKTRDAVAAAALYLATYKYEIPYSWGGKYTEKGFPTTNNIKWGCKTKVEDGNPCSNRIDSNTCEKGLDCTGYTSWAYAQAGFSSNILRTSSQSTGMWGNFNANTHKYSFKNNQNMVSQIKPGDIVHTEGHVGIVLGVSSTTLQVANEWEGIRISIIQKSDGKSTNNDKSFDNFVLFDDFFKMYGNN